MYYFIIQNIDRYFLLVEVSYKNMKILFLIIQSYDDGALLHDTKFLLYRP